MTDRKELIRLLSSTSCHGPGESLGSCPDRKYGMCGEVADLSYCVIQNLANHLIQNGVTIQAWIPVTERMPKYFEHVLINAPGDKPFTTVHEAHLRKDGLWDTGLYRYDREDVTHWMPLPEPPEEDVK